MQETQRISRKTVLITGTSSGIGRASARYFQARGWNVIATMRTPEKEADLTTLDRVLVTRLDVTDVESIEKAFAEGRSKFGRVDAVVNNAGYGLLGAFEGINGRQIEKQFQTNVFGLMEVVRVAVRTFRSQGPGGQIINVSSMGGRLTIPLYSVYHASKWAVEGFSESLAFELKPFGIRVKLIEPGAIKTDFYDRSADRGNPGGDYSEYSSAVFEKLDSAGARGSSPELVARAIFRATASAGRRMRYPVGPDARLLLLLRRLLPERWFTGAIGCAVANAVKNFGKTAAA